MKNFIDYLLLGLICLIIYTYIQQNECRNNNNSNENYRNISVENNKISKNSNIQGDTLYTTPSNETCFYNPQHQSHNKNNLNRQSCQNKQNKSSIHSDKRKNDLVEFTNGKTYRGPAIHFHQCFNPSNMKDLGWREWWFKNKNKNLVKEPKQFQSIMRNYMDKQENTKNLYL
jgi:hypothetical protein